MRIGELARRTGVAERLLRYYEQQGLLHPVRTANGYREYAEDDAAQVAWIRRLLAAGLSTATIAEFMDCARAGFVPPAEGCGPLTGRLREERDRIEAAIADLSASRAALDVLIGSPTWW
jgi:DNA-binding transcriptional MerR regulator